MGKSHLRWASKKDAEELSAIGISLARDTYPYMDADDLDRFIERELSPEAISNAFDRNTRYAFVEYNGKVAGFTAYYIYDRKMHVDKIYFSKEFRGFGLGTDVINRLSVIADGLGCTEIELTLVDRNQGAAKFYESLGFRRVSAQTDYAEPRSLLSKALV